MNPLIQVKNTIPLFLLVLACLALSPQARATCREGCDLSNANTFLGNNALIHNIAGLGGFSTAIGEGALSTNTGGFRNTATGVLALADNTTGSNNTASGFLALSHNTGVSNTAISSGALGSNTTGFGNTAIGDSALGDNTTGGYNIAVGFIRVQISPRAVTIWISETLASPGNRIPSASALKELKQMHIWQGFIRHTSQRAW